MLLKRGRQGEAKKSRADGCRGRAGGTQRGARLRVALGARGRRSGQRGAELGPPPAAAPRAGWRGSQAEELLPWPSALARKCGSDLGRDKPAGVPRSAQCPSRVLTGGAQ